MQFFYIISSSGKATSVQPQFEAYLMALRWQTTKPQ